VKDLRVLSDLAVNTFSGLRSLIICSCFCFCVERGGNQWFEGRSPLMVVVVGGDFNNGSQI